MTKSEDNTRRSPQVSERDRPSPRHTDRMPTAVELSSAARELHQLLGVMVDAMNGGDETEPRSIWGDQWRGDDETVWNRLLADPALRARLRPVHDAVEAFVLTGRKDGAWSGNGVLLALLAREYVRGGMSAEQAVKRAQEYRGPERWSTTKSKADDVSELESVVISLKEGVAKARDERNKMKVVYNVLAFGAEVEPLPSKKLRPGGALTNLIDSLLRVDREWWDPDCVEKVVTDEGVTRVLRAPKK